MSDYQPFDCLYERNDGYLANDDGVIVVYCDGACPNNHKTDGIIFSGCGVFWGWNARSDSIHYPKFSENHNHLNTNQFAEARACLYAARHAQRMGFDSIELRTDSRFVIKSMTEYIWSWLNQDSDVWRTQMGTPVKHQSIWEEIHDIRDDIKMKFQFVPGHQGEEGNEEADRLATQAAAHAKSLYERDCNNYSDNNSDSSESSSEGYYHYY